MKKKKNGTLKNKLWIGWFSLCLVYVTYRFLIGELGWKDTMICGAIAILFIGCDRMIIEKKKNES